MADWTISIGDAVTRTDLAARYGGNKQAGIMASAQTANVMVFSDPIKAAQNGYDFDGWVGADLYQYTGDGQEGDQTWSPGNSRIRDHRNRGDSIRVFVANGIRPGTKGTIQQLYLGKFSLDETEPITRAECPDKNGENRSVIIFRLRPVGEVLRRAEDETEQPIGASDEPAQIQEVDLSIDDIGVQQQHNVSFRRSAMQSVEGRRREADLVLRYETFLKKRNHDIGSKRISGRGLHSTLEVDLFDRTTGDLVEAKSEATRENIRYALGQVLDYRRFVQPTSCAVLLPSLPSNELVELLTHNGVACVYETTKGSFERIEATSDGRSD